MIHKNRANRRWQRHLHIVKKKRICNNHMTFATYECNNGKLRSDFSREVPMEWYKYDGQYDKGKIHCGCKLCKPYRGYYPSMKDEKIRHIADYKIKEYEKEA